jgi:hypothetical protein
MYSRRERVPDESSRRSKLPAEALDGDLISGPVSFVDGFVAYRTL